MRRTILAFACVATLGLGCVAVEPGRQPSPSGSGLPKTTTATPQDIERLRRVMLPLLAVMNNPIPANQVSVGILDSSEINAANAGSGRFFVTRGLLTKANDDHLMAVLAHEIAHDDLNHVEKAQVLGVGLGLGVAILDQVFPGSGVVTPVAGELVARKYSRDEEYAADAHGAEILQRAGQRKGLMVETLTWLMQESGPSPGGFFSTHPGTTERIAALR
ncbi:MAG TPA: M48 family metallopeptidase, partial [Myxococcota bacterium]|nr:M48 family metallopeptidase [Myxococcota bacterium]